mmetsp:Transcript_17117/g.27200  ORF Transcript_17117/g.27200 Transcript_17117/m.27200 type:complete len:219 (-) Transcript_17117:590-1246(-)
MNVFKGKKNKWAYLSMNVFKGKKDPEQIRNKIKYLKTMGNFMDQTAEPIIGPSSAGETPPEEIGSEEHKAMAYKSEKKELMNRLATGPPSVKLVLKNETVVMFHRPGIAKFSFKVYPDYGLFVWKVKYMHPKDMDIFNSPSTMFESGVKVSKRIMKALYEDHTEQEELVYAYKVPDGVRSEAGSWSWRKNKHWIGICFQNITTDSEELDCNSDEESVG